MKYRAIEYKAVGEYLIVEKLSWLKTEIELPDSMKSDEGIVRGEVLSIGNQQYHFDDMWSQSSGGKLNVNDIILYDARVGLEIEKTGNYLIRFANILAIEIDEELVKKSKKKRSELAAENAFKKKPIKKKKTEKERMISS